MRLPAVWVVAVLGHLAACDGKAYKLGGGDGPGGSGVGGAGGASGPVGRGAGGSLGSSAGFAGIGGAAVGGAGGAPGAALTDELVRIASEPYGVFYIEADDSHVYFTDWGGPVWRVDHAGAGRIQLANSAAYHMLSDATHLYFTTDVDIQRVAKTGGPAEVLVTLRDVSKVTAAALELALDQTYVYASTYEDGTVVRVPKTGGESRVLAQATDYMGGVAVSGGALYWAEYGQGGVYRTDLETGDRTLFYPGGAWRLQAVGADLWFAPVSEAAIVRAPFDGAGVTRYPFETYTTHFRGDDTHVYWVWSALVRRSLITGIEEKVADLPVHAAANVALTPHWIFVGDSSSSNGGLYRLPKPAP